MQGRDFREGNLKVVPERPRKPRSSLPWRWIGFFAVFLFITRWALRSLGHQGLGWDVGLCVVTGILYGEFLFRRNR